MTIDDQVKAKELVRRMKEQLPISAQPTKKLVRALEEQGVKIGRNQALQIEDVFYSGDLGGISCGIALKEEKKEILVVSVTHLRVDLKHPLASEIRAYQKERTRRLAQSGR